MSVPTRQFLDILISQGIITQEQSQKYEIDSLQKDLAIDDYLIEHTQIEREQILKAKASLLNIPWVMSETMPLSPEALALLPESITRSYFLIPYEINAADNTLKVAMADPFDVQTISFLQKKTGMKIVPVLALKSDVIKTIELAYSQNLSPNISDALKEVERPVQTLSAENMGELIKEAPIAKIVKTILEFALKGRASDIHIEAQEVRTRVRYRIDGILQEKLALPLMIHDSLVSRIKILSGLKIDEKRAPQDGRFNFKMGEDEVDLRVSTLPTVHGEKVVMRLLKKTGGIPALSQLGFRETQLKLLYEGISKPYGIILVTGPTGSGKSTTLYSVLNMLNKPTVNIMTLEDPVEYQLEGINQIQVNVQAGLTFASGLRSFLRQDPNIILVGEIRDKETTQLALQAALTGHLVFSTLHTNDAATAIPRLIDLGGEPFLIASVLNAIVAQRIARRLDVENSELYTPENEIIENIVKVLGKSLPEEFKKDPSKIQLRRRKDTSTASSGYHGRIGIYEVIPISKEVNSLILNNATASDIKEMAKSEGMITMKQDGYLKALEGITTIEEVLRVAESDS